MAKDEAKIKFTAETQEFQSQIKDANSEIQSLKAEMKLADAQFRNTGDSQEYQKQKLELLTQQLEANKEKQEALNSEIEVASSIYGEDSAQVQQLETSLTYARIQEENLKGAINSTNSELESQSGASDTASQSLETMANIQASEFLEDLSSKAFDAMESLYDLADAAAGVTDHVDKQSQKLGISREAYMEWDYVLSQNGSSVDSLSRTFKGLSEDMTSIKTKADFNESSFKKLGMSFDDFKNMSSEDLFSAIITGLQGMEEGAERDALASDLLGKSYQDLAPLLNSSADSTQALKDKAHELGLVLGDDVVDKGVAFTDQMDTLDRSIDTVKTTLGVALMPVIDIFAGALQTCIPFLQDLATWFGDLVESSPLLQAVLTGVVVAFGTLAAALGIAGLIQGVSTAFGILNTVMMANPIILVVTLIAGLVAALVYAYQNCEEFRNIVNGAFEAISGVVSPILSTIASTVSSVWSGILGVTSSVWSGVVSAISSPMETAKSTVKGIIDAIKGFFSFSISWPHIPLPHFGISPAGWSVGDLLKGTIPSLSINWYAKAMNSPQILDGATIFGMANGKLLGGGEAGREIVGGADTVAGLIYNSVQSAVSGMIDYDLLADKVARACANMNITMECNEREFGRLVREVV